MFWIACVLASSGTIHLPRYASEPVVGAAVTFVIDVSNSMLTDDGTGRQARRGDRLRRPAGIRLKRRVPVARRVQGQPVTLCPSTTDGRAFEDALRWAGPSVTTAAGSDVGAAIDEAARPVDGRRDGPGHRRAERRQRHRFDGARAASPCGRFRHRPGFRGLRQRDAPVRFRLSGAAVLGVDGVIAETGLDDASMREWAAAAHGTFVRADSNDAFSKVAAICGGASTRAGRRRDVRVETDASPALALVALAALGMAVALSWSPSARRPGGPAAPRGGIRRRRTVA